MTSNCGKCATLGECTYASSESNGRAVLHNFCGKQGENFWCCPTERDGRSAECSVTWGRCDYVEVWSYGTVLIGTIIPILFVMAIVSYCVYMRRRQTQVQVIANQAHGMGPGGVPFAVPAGQEGNYAAYNQGQGGFSQPGYAQPVQQPGRQGLGAGGAAALGVGGGLLGGMFLANAFDGGDYGGGDGGDFAGDIGL